MLTIWALPLHQVLLTIDSVSMESVLLLRLLRRCAMRTLVSFGISLIANRIANGFAKLGAFAKGIWTFAKFCLALRVATWITSVERQAYDTYDDAYEAMKEDVVQEVNDTFDEEIFDTYNVDDEDGEAELASRVVNGLR